ncbi:MAG: delta-class carbonic anhydrase [Pseudomonadota bacterium]
MKYTLSASVMALALAGCAVDPAATDAAVEEAAADVVETASVEETVEEAVETVEEAASDALCLASGPQTPRDISSALGLNPTVFPMAPATTGMNLCNIHTHTNAEHKGPGFNVFVDSSDYGGYACNETADLTEAELTSAPGAYGKVKPGDTIEVHWVHTSCDIEPGEGLGSCLSETCTDPLLRVEAQTFLVVNDPEAADFTDMADTFVNRGGFHQPKMIPASTGEPVVFLGSTTGPSYTQSACSPLQVTWSVRPQCMKVDINSLHAWAEEGNVFNETASHGVRQLVTAPELLSTIE